MWASTRRLWSLTPAQNKSSKAYEKKAKWYTQTALLGLNRCSDAQSLDSNPPLTSKRQHPDYTGQHQIQWDNMWRWTLHTLSHCVQKTCYYYFWILTDPLPGADSLLGKWEGLGLGSSSQLLRCHGNEKGRLPCIPQCWRFRGQPHPQISWLTGHCTLAHTHPPWCPTDVSLQLF